MKRLLLLALQLFVLSTLAVAQPGGHFGGFPGGRPMGPPPSGFRPGNRPGGDHTQMDQRNNTVRQKRVVREGSTFKVVGTLRDSATREPLVYVNVAVLDSADSAFVKGASTDFDGAFEVTDVPAGTYLMRISYVGYQTRYVPFTVTNNTTLGTIFMRTGANTLKAVQITAEKPLYAMEGEKLIYNVSEDPSIQSGTTSDALQNAPGVEVDIEGNITLRGVSSVEIWINDKPSKLTAENLKTYLETLPANALDRIEAITNPSAKYATESEAVINIVTSAHIKKNHFISFGVNGATQPSVSPWVSYMWANEKLSVNVFANGRYSYSNSESFRQTWTRGDDTVNGGYDTLMYQYDSSQSESRSYSGMIFMNVNYTVDSMTDVEVHGSMNYTLSNALSTSSALRDATMMGGAYNLYFDTTDNHGNISAFGSLGASYVHKFDHEGHNLRIMADGHFSGSDRAPRFVRDYAVDSTGLDQQRFSPADGNSIYFGLNSRYNRPYSKDGEMSYGLGYGFSKLNNIYNPYYLLASGGDSTDVLRKYEFLDYENNLNGDVNWTHRFGNFTLELGLGANLTKMHFTYAVDNDIYGFLADDQVHHFITYTPSIHTSYRTESMHNFKLNYALRMRNPAEYQLMRRRSYTDDSYSTGNPNLTASLTHNAEVGWTKFFSRFGNVGLEGYVRYSTNEINDLTDNEYDNILDRYISYTTPYNLGSSYRYGISTNITYRPSGFLNVRLYGNLYHSGYEFQSDRFGADAVKNGMTSGSLRLNCWAKVLNRYQVHASANWTSPTQSLFAERKARYFLNLGVRSDFFKRKMSVYVNVQDLFNWGKTIGGGSTNTNPYLLSNTNTYTLNSRYISAGLVFRFGKMELERNAREGAESDGTSME